MRSVALLAALVAAAFAQHWNIEQVDSASIGGFVAIDRTSDGTIWVAYVNADSSIRLAHKDSVWVFEDLDTALVRPMLVQHPSWAPFSFDIGPGDVIGVTGLSRLAEHRTSGWSSEELPALMYPRALVYDAEGRPSLTFDDSLWRGCFGLRTDSGWDTSVVFWDSSGAQIWFSSTRPAWCRNGNCAFMSDYNWWEGGGAMEGYDMFLFKRDSGTWTVSTMIEEYEGGSKSLALLADSSDSLHTFWGASDNRGTNVLVCDQTILDSFSNVGDACLDTAGRMQCAWIRGGFLKFAVPGRGTWAVPGVGNPVWCDITIDTMSQPVIAFCETDGSIWLAHGVDVVGQSEERGEPTAHSLQLTVSIIRNVLFLPEASSHKPQGASWLLEASGRKVMELRAGPNDVSRLPAGLYFIRELTAGRTRKVIVTR